MVRKPKTQATDHQDDASAPTLQTTPVEPTPPKSPNKLETLTELLRREGGATIAELSAATGWQSHSVRGAMSGTLKKRGLEITSTKTDGVRR